MLAQRLLTHIPDNFEHPTHLTGGYFSRETGYDKLPFNCNEHKNPFSALKPEKKNTHTEKSGISHSMQFHSRQFV